MIIANTRLDTLSRLDPTGLNGWTRSTMFLVARNVRDWADRPAIVRAVEIETQQRDYVPDRSVMRTPGDGPAATSDGRTDPLPPGCSTTMPFAG